MTNVKIIIGASYGDEGKGLMSDYFCSQAKERGKKCIVVLSNGGAQRGHTVDTPDGKHHVFHHFGSGTLVGADTHFPAAFIVNPMIFVQEWAELYGKVDVMPYVFANPQCLCSTPFDMILNQIAEQSRGVNRHGSCGCGIWETIVRDGLRLQQMYKLYRKNRLYDYLLTIRDLYVPLRLRDLGISEISPEWKKILFSSDLISNYIGDFGRMMSVLNFSYDEIIKKYQTVVFENGQGLLLDQNTSENQEHTTPSNTGTQNPAIILENVYGEDELYLMDIEVCYVSRTYLTRHGDGPFKEECNKDELFPGLNDETNVWNPHQGGIRYGKLDLYELFHRCIDDFMKYMRSGKVSMAFTHMNEMPEYFKDVEFYTDLMQYHFSDSKTRKGVRGNYNGIYCGK